MSRDATGDSDTGFRDLLNGIISINSGEPRLSAASGPVWIFSGLYVC